MATTPQEAKQIPLIGVSAGWLLKLSGSDGDDLAVSAPDKSDADTFLFSDLESHPQAKLLEASADSGEKEEIPLADKTVIEFKVATVRLSGEETVDGTDDADAKEITSTDDLATGKGEFTIAVRGADIQSKFWGNYVEKMKAAKDNTYLLILPSRITRHGLDQAKPASGYYYATVKRSGEIDLETSPQNITFKTVKYPVVDGDITTAEEAWQTVLSGLDYTNGKIKMKRNQAIELEPITLATPADDAIIAEIAAGGVGYKTQEWT